MAIELDSVNVYERDLSLMHNDSLEKQKAYAELMLVLSINDVLIDLKEYKRPISFSIKNGKIEDLVWSESAKTPFAKNDLIAAKVGAWEWFFCPWRGFEPRYTLESVCEVLDVDPDLIRDFIDDICDPPGCDMPREERRALFVDCTLVDDYEEIKDADPNTIFEAQGALWKMIREDRLQPGSGRRSAPEEDEREENMLFSLQPLDFEGIDPLSFEIGDPDPETNRIVKKSFGVEKEEPTSNTGFCFLPVLSYKITAVSKQEGDPWEENSEGKQD